MSREGASASHKFTTRGDGLLLLEDPSLYAARNTSALQIAIKADVTPLGIVEIGFTGTDDALRARGILPGNE